MIGLFARRVALVVAAAGACWGLAVRFGPQDAALAWAVVAAIACVIGAALLRTSPVGRVGWQNRVAAYLVPWGWGLCGGRLWPIPVASWVVWAAVGTATVLLLSGSEPVAGWGIAVRILLFAAWVADGAALLYVLGSLLRHVPPAPAILKVAAVLGGLITGSVALYLGELPVLALAVAGGPPLLVGGGYALFFGAVLMSGRNARWN